MEYEPPDRDSLHRRHSHYSRRRQSRDEDHAGHHDFHNWAVKRVRFRTRSSPPPPHPSLRYGFQKLSLRDDHDDEYSTWDKPVVFAPEEASYRPQRWLEKLEKLEAQIVTGSAQPGPTLFEPIPASHSLHVQREELHRLRPVLIGVRENLRTLQQAHYCSQSINMLVLEKDRKDVVCLVDLTISVIRDFIAEAIQFIDHDDIVHLSTTGRLLGRCVNILTWMEIRPRVLQQFRLDEMGRGSVRSTDYYERVWSRGIVTSALIHALRATAYTLDIAVVSFIGAHLEPFDEVYFKHDHRHHHHDRRQEFYKIPCDEHVTSSIILCPRYFDCLSGFLGKNPAWVFETHEKGQPLYVGRPLYLRTSPEQLANVWGPLWRAETRERGGASRFMLSKGFLVGWHHSSTVDPRLDAEEYLCHWTNNPTVLAENTKSAAGLPRYVNIKYLLIGAHTIPEQQKKQHLALELNKHCPTTSTEIYHQLHEHHELTKLGTHFAEWYLGPSNMPISVDPPGGFLGYGTELVFKRRQGTSCREAVCSKLVAQPWKYLGLLADLYGISISGCTGNAWRDRLLDVILSPTMREFVGCQLPWVLESDEWHHFRDLILWHSSESNRRAPDYVHISNHTTESQRYDYARYLKLSIGAIKDLPIHSASDHVDALFAYHGSEYQVSISQGESECGWLGLLNDSLTAFSAPIVEVSSCLECRPGGMFCHHYHHHHFHHRRPPRTSSNTLDVGDDHYYLAPPRTSGRSPSVVSTLSTSSRRSSFSVASGASRSRSRISQGSSHGHASHGYGTVLETTILVNPHALPAPLSTQHAGTSPRPRSRNYYNDKYHGKYHDWNYMEYMDWKHPDRRSSHSAVSETSETMMQSYPKGTIIDLGDAGELKVLGHLTVNVAHRGRGAAGVHIRGESRSRSRSRSRSISRRRKQEEEDEEVILIVERRRPKERSPRTVKYFLEKVHNPVVRREFHHDELVRLDGIAECVRYGYAYTGTKHGDDEDDDEAVIMDEEEEDRERGRERLVMKDGHMETVSEVQEEYEIDIENDGEGRGTRTVTTHRVYPGLRLRWPGRLLHMLVVSDVHDGLISEWVRDLEVEE
ncbi:hypothetical protein V8F06_001599 [Rhypophila decipiens]